MILSILLALSLTGGGLTPSPVYVDRVEINHVEIGDVNQVLLWRWTPASGDKSRPPGYRVAQWWKIEQPPLVTRINGGWLIQSRGVLLFTKSFGRTKTKNDPEVADRQILEEDKRLKYVEPEPLLNEL
jgi:hypothetical protein